MVVVGVGFEVVVMMVGEVGEDEFETDLDDEEGDDETDVGLNIYVPDEIDDSRDEDGNRNPGVIHSLGGGGGEDGGINTVAGGLEVVGEEIFKCDAGNEDDDDWYGVIW